MPIVPVNRDRLFEALGRNYSERVLFGEQSRRAHRGSCCFHSSARAAPLPFKR
jgi:hypothetical protein